MKIIFIKDVKGQGKKNDIKEVKPGYGEYLIKSGNAVLCTNKSITILENEKNELKEIEKKEENEALELKKKLEKLLLKFSVKTGEKDKVFGNVSSKQISEELKKLGFNIDKKKIIIDYPLNMLGRFTVNVNIYKKINASLKVELVK